MVRKTKKKVVKKQKSKASGSEVFAGDKVLRMTETEALRFGKLDAEIRNNLQGIQLAALQSSALTRDYQDKKASLAHLQAAHQKEVDRLRPMLTDLVKELAEKYGIPDPSRLVVDPDNGTLRDAETDV